MMDWLRGAFVIVCGVIGLAATGASAPAWSQTPQSECSVLSGHACHPSFCGVFHRGPCLPYYWPPIGEDLRLTIVSTDDNDPSVHPPVANDGNGDGEEAPEEKPLDSISAMYAALRACWVPPP